MRHVLHTTLLALCISAIAATGVAHASLPDITATATASAGNGGAVVAFAPAGFTCLPASGSTFQVGSTAVMCRTAGGDIDAFQVHVLAADLTPPIISIRSSSTVPATSAAGAVVTYAAPIVADDRAGVGAPVCSPAAGSQFPVGPTSVSCSVRDAAGNTTSRVFTTITVSGFTGADVTTHREPQALPFIAKAGRIAAPRRAALLRSGIVAPVTCNSSCTVKLTVQAARKVKVHGRVVTRYARMGGGSKRIAQAATNVKVTARLTSSWKKLLAKQRAPQRARIVVTIKHPGAKTIVITRSLRL